MTGEPFATGRCLCGAVSYTISANPIRMAQCHCKDCQRRSGTGHASNAFFKADDVRIEGPVKGFAVTADSGNIVTWHFCPTCGSRIYAENSARPGVIGIAVGSADDHDWFEPQSVLYAKRRPKWDVTSTAIPNFDTMPPVPPAPR